jgi:NAD(P)-dependent dehydrogenase (short-subunit alcohol dehydrogenase family)
MTPPLRVETRPVAVVTGASRGLGFLIAKELGRRGHDLVICARDLDALESAAQELVEATGGAAHVQPIRCDISDRAQADRLIEETVARFGRIDVLVNNAGIIQVGPMASMTHDDYEDAMAVMYFGVLYPSLAAIPHLKESRGRLVNITSVGGKVAAPHMLPYGAAKFAAVGLSSGMHAELAKDGVAVTTVVPGLMRTGSPTNALFKGDARREYQWFTVADSIPGLSVGADRAARRIVRAAMRRRAEVHLTPTTRLAAMTNGVLPGTTARMLGVVNRLLPDDADPRPVPGHQVDMGDMPRWFRAVTTLTRRAEVRNREQVDRSGIPEPRVGRWPDPGTATPTPADPAVSDPAASAEHVPSSAEIAELHSRH